MNAIKDGGPAFPVPAMEYNYGTERRELAAEHPGMTLRDYFAVRCPAEEIKDRMPKTLGELADAYVWHGWIDEQKRKSVRSVTDLRELEDPKLHRRLRAIVRYEYADDMLEARKQ